MSNKQILVIVVDPEAKTIEADTIDDNLESMQRMVGGYIERVFAPLGDDAEVMWCDEEGKLKENFHFHIKGFPDIISGKAFICREVQAMTMFLTATRSLTWLPCKNLLLGCHTSTAKPCSES